MAKYYVLRMDEEQKKKLEDAFEGSVESNQASGAMELLEDVGDGSELFKNADCEVKKYTKHLDRIASGKAREFLQSVRFTDVVEEREFLKGKQNGKLKD